WGRTCGCRGRGRAGARSYRTPCARARSFRAALEILQSDSHDRSSALPQRTVVPLGLGPDEAAEAEVLPGDRDLLAGLVDDLDEEPRRGAALVELPRRMEVARPKAVRDDAAGLVPTVDQRLQLALAHRIDERLDPDVVRRLGAGQYLVQRACWLWSWILA